MSKISNIRNNLSFIVAILLFWLYIPHLLAYLLCKEKDAIRKDIQHAFKIKHIHRQPNIISLVYKLHSDAYFRTVFYHRIGVVARSLIGWYRPGEKYFQIPHTTRLGAGIGCHHPFATILNAKEIGDNFVCRNNTTIGFKTVGVGPTIGDNVNLGVGVIIIGDIHIGNNVNVGAGSVIVKDVPDNVTVVGNPAKIIKYNSKNNTNE